MTNIEILCATMNQTDFSKIDEMNIHADVLFTNQSGRNAYDEHMWGGHRARMVTTNTIGVGINRNIGLLYATGDILLFADDDFIYDDNLEENILKAFEKCKKADVIIFGNRYSKNGEVYKVRQLQNKKLPIYQSMKFGTYVLAIKRDVVLKHNLTFSNLFGGGCIYSHGEDSDFILQCFKNKLKIYTSDYILGTTAKDSSTCFFGYNEKYFFDKGALARNSFGIWAGLFMLYISIKEGNGAEISFYKRLKCMKAGYRNFKYLKSYAQWAKEQTEFKIHEQNSR